MRPAPSSLHVNDAHSWRGGEQQTLLLMRGLAATGHGVALAAPPGAPLARAAAESGIVVHPLVLRGELDLPGAVALAALLRRAAPTLLHAHTAHALAACAVARRLAAGATPIVFSRRVDFPVRGGPFGLGRRKYLAADAILAVSAAAAAVVASAGVPPSRIRVVHDGVDATRFDTPALDLPAALGLPAGARVVLNVAALADHKDQRTLVHAAVPLTRRFPDVHVVIAGEGPERAVLTALIAALGLESRVHLLGFRHDVPGLLRGAAVAVMCSHLEGLGSAVLDAMVCGVPLVATRAGGLPELVEDGVSGLLVPVRDPDALAGAIGAVLDDTALAATLAAGGRERARGFTADRMVEGTLAAYRELG
jgi:glycosyltransferase involved in cell wall biosynthesis